MKPPCAAASQKARKIRLFQHPVRAIAKAQADEDAEKKRLASYEEKAQEFLRKNASLPDAQKQARLRELRVELLGPEEAAAYERRKQFEEAVGKIK